MNIVVGVDESDTARKAAETAAKHAAVHGANLHIVMCTKKGQSHNLVVGSDSWLIDPLESSKTYLDDLGRALGVDSVTTSIAYGDPATAMCDEAARLDADLIVVGNRRLQGVSRVLGAVAADVLKKAPCDVLVAYTRGE